MDDADLAGPLLFGFCFGMFLLLVRLLLFNFSVCYADMLTLCRSPVNRSLATSTALPC